MQGHRETLETINNLSHLCVHSCFNKTKFLLLTPQTKKYFSDSHKSILKYTVPYKTVSCRALGRKNKTFKKSCIKGPEALSHHIKTQGTVASKRVLLGKNHLFPAAKASKWYSDVKSRPFKITTFS